MSRWFLALALAGCGPVDVVVATLPPGGFPMTKPCTVDADCSGHGAFFCEKETCGVLSGQCRQIPSQCEGTYLPVCGCNGFTYWNDCYRRLAGFSLLATKECAAPVQARCNRSGECPSPPSIEASCVFLSPNVATCATPVGACWVISDPCHTAAVKLSRSCVTDECQDLCVSIQKGEPGYRAGDCP